MTLTIKQAEILEKMKRLDAYKMALLCNTADVLYIVQNSEENVSKKN